MVVGGFMSGDDRNSWHDAVIDELVCCGILNEAHETNPRKAVQDLIDWNVKVALDPLVSAEARALQEQQYEHVGVVRSQSLGEVQYLKHSPANRTNLYVKIGEPLDFSVPPVEL